MKLRIAFTVSLERSKKASQAGDEPPFIHESSGSLVETRQQPSYVGFEAVEPDVWEDRRRQGRRTR